MKNTMILLSMMAFVTFPAFAQEDRELFRARYEVSPVGLSGKNEAVSLFETSIRIPVVVRDTYQVATGIRYESLWTNSDSLLGTHTLQGASGQISFNRRFSRERAIQFFVSGGIFSDFQDVTAEDFRFSLGARYKTKIHDRFTLSYGLIYSKQFFGDLIAPFVDFNWKISKHLVLSGPFPISPKLEYTLASKAKLSLFLKPDNATFRLSESESKSQYFQKKQWSAGLGFDYKVCKHWMVSLKTGTSLRRQFEIYESSEKGIFSILTIDVNGKKRTPVFAYEKNAFFGDITISWLIAQQ